MSIARATIVSRIEDWLLRVFRRMRPGLEKLMMVYVSSPAAERIERGFVRALLLGTVRTYRAFGLVEPAILRIYRGLTKSLASVQASLEDIVSFASSYMSLLFVVAMIAVVVTAWALHPLPLSR